MILSSAEVLAHPRDQVGGKAWGLAKLSSLARVPEFRVIIPDDKIECDLEKLHSEFVSESGRYAVRSSAAVEDSANASYAGMFLTLLDVNPPGLRDAISKVAASGLTSRVTELEQALGRPGKIQPSISVVVQRMVDATSSGVALSYAPNSGGQSALIEAIFGLGEPLVSGKIPPDSWLIDRRTSEIVQYRAGRQVWRQQRGQRTLLKSYESNLPKLSTDQVAAVSKLLFAIEQGVPLEAADIEFCFDREDLYALQARPLLSR